MSKNISIAEGGVARQFTNDKLKINLVGGGTEYYVPESGVQLTTKSVTANGTYKASDEGKYGFSQFSVNVRGAAGSADSHGKPNTSGDIKPGGAGSAVVGTDPETGNDVVVGVDDAGNLVQTTVPSGIWIRTPPTKTIYNAGDTMIYDGIVVSPIKRDQSTFVDDRYSGGHIPFSELIFPVEVAESPIVPVEWVSPYTGEKFSDTFTITGVETAISNLNNWNRQYFNPTINYSNGINTFTYRFITGDYERLYIPFDVAENTNYIFEATFGPSGYTEGNRSGTHTYMGVASIVPSAGHYIEDVSSVITKTQFTQAGGTVACNFNSSSRSTVYLFIDFAAVTDGETDSFAISGITCKAGSSHTTESSSGTEGSGGGGTF